MANVFKENWLKTDICCEKCGQVVEKQKGLTKQNVKRLFTMKFTMDELLITFIIIMVLVSAYAYKMDTQVCREYVKQAEANFVPINPPNTNTLCNDDSELCNLMITNKTG